MTHRQLVLSVTTALALIPPAGAAAFDRPGDAAISGTLGGLVYIADEDSRSGASPRFAFGGYGEYSPSLGWALRLESGFGWNAYPEDKSPTSQRSPRPVKIVSPTTLSLIKRLNPSSESFLYAGAGGGLYFWRYKINGKVQRDPETLQEISSGSVGTFDFGFSGLLGYEHPLSPSVAVSAEAHAHYVFSANAEDRPEKDPGSEFESFPVFNGNDAFVVARIGVKLYFDLIRFEKPEEGF